MKLMWEVTYLKTRDITAVAIVACPRSCVRVDCGFQWILCFRQFQLWWLSGPVAEDLGPCVTAASLLPDAGCRAPSKLNNLGSGGLSVIPHATPLPWR